MKHLNKYVLLLFFVAASAICNAQHVNFITNGNLRTVFDLAKAQHKKIFLELYDKDCHTCNLFEPIFKDKKVAQYFNDHFVSYKLPITAIETNAFLAKQKTGPLSTPTFLFYTEDVKLIYKVSLTDKQNTAEIVLQQAKKAVSK